MLLKTLIPTVAATLFTGYAVAQDLPAIEVVGKKFFYSNNGSQFYIKGVAYQADTANVTGGATINDPLADIESCKRDVPYLKQVDTNVVRVYAVNTSLDHSECMQALMDANIYVIADLSSPKESINRDEPTWTVELFDHYKSVVDLFSNYTNVLGFFAGNEVTNNSTNTDASAFVKAAIRDTKSYISNMGYRSIPVGYSSNDDADTRVPMADYFTCGDNDVMADFYGINMYEWCGDSSFQLSGYAARTKDFANITVPVFFSEYGCNKVQPRKFTEVQALYGDEMTDVWSGGIVYMYFEETNNYGLVTIEDDGNVSTLADFDNYSKEIYSVSPTIVNKSTYTPTNTQMECPATNSFWKANTDLPPTPNNDLCLCMDAANSCVVTENTPEDDYEDLFNYICGQIDCKGISGNGITGTYGAYSFCSAKEQLNFVLNLYYQSKGENESNCNFSGSATIQSATTQSGCSAALSSIGTLGANVYTSDVTFTSNGASGSSGPSTASTNDSSNASSSKSNSKSGNASASAKKNASVSLVNNKSVWETVLSSLFTIGLLAGFSFTLF